MTTRIGTITIDTNDLERAAAFWQGVTGYDVTSNDGSFATLAPADGSGPGLAIQAVPEARPTGKNRIHLDVVADDLDAEVARIGGLGATEVRRVEDGGYRWTVMADTEGNEFCVVAA